MTTFLTLTRCADAASTNYDPVYPDGSTDFELINAPDGVSIDNTTGRVTIGTVEIGEYISVIQYAISDGEGGYTYFFGLIKLLIIDCSPVLMKSDFFFCIGGEKEIQLYSNKVIGSIISPPAWLNDLGEGLIRVNTSELVAGDSYEVSVLLDGTPVAFNLYPINCDASNYFSAVECERDPLQIIWKNRSGGWNNYWLNQGKIFSVDQKGGKSYININDEEKWTNRGNIYDFIEVNQNQIPKEHVDLLRSLRDSIQVYLATDITDHTTFVSIKLDEGTFDLYESGQEYFSLSFKFKFSKRRKVQRQ